jgi:hypothetical protein
MPPVMIHRSVPACPAIALMVSHRVIGRRLERARDQVAAGEQDRREGGRDNRPPVDCRAERTGQAAGIVSRRTCRWQAVLIVAAPAGTGVLG